MCSHHHAKARHRKQQRKSAEETRQEFFRNLVIFGAVNFYFLFINGRFESWYWVTLFWGISILSQYNKAKWALNGDLPPTDDEDNIVPPPPPKWKDKDLV